MAIGVCYDWAATAVCTVFVVSYEDADVAFVSGKQKHQVVLLAVGPLGRAMRWGSQSFRSSPATARYGCFVGHGQPCDLWLMHRHVELCRFNCFGVQGQAAKSMCVAIARAGGCYWQYWVALLAAVV